MLFIFSHFLHWLFRKQISERRELPAKTGPTGLLKKNLHTLRFARGSIFFRKVLSFSPPCSGVVAYKKPPEAYADGLIKKQHHENSKWTGTTIIGDIRTADHHNGKKDKSILKLKIMKTTVIESNAKTNNGVKDTNPVTVENKNPQFVAGNVVNKDSVKPVTENETETLKEQPQAEAIKVDVSKAEQAKPQSAKTVLNLESTLKLVEEMHRKIKHRTKLRDTIDNLESFEVELRDEADTTDTNYYTGCKLSIEDDKRNSFETKNPTIIWAVAQMVNSMCVDKLAEIEAGIVLPQ
jgi:hypothetical protein